MRNMKDHLGRETAYPFPPKRVVSLCPSITETLFDLGLTEKEVVGRTRYCIHPESLVKQVRTVGGTKKIKTDVVAELKPDLIIAEKEENPKETIEALEKDFPVFVADVRSYEDALTMIRDLGKLLDREKKAEALTEKIEQKFDFFGRVSPRSMAYLIWKNPYMAAGSDTFIDSMLQKAGFTNVFANRPERYPEIEVADLRQASPEFVFLSSEPYPFQDADRKELREHLSGCEIVAIDGEICWYGSRMLKAADLLNQLSETL
ncbi:MAG TPA: helical backbone metal receptor [Bacillales bacterium]|nr:helical backbone metal receptor [Bacillales bacterium]